MFDVVGCAMEVLNELGHGLLEKPYENALFVELGLKYIQVEQDAVSVHFESDDNQETLELNIVIPEQIES